MSDAALKTQMLNDGLSDAAQGMVLFGMKASAALPWIIGIGAAIGAIAIGVNAYKKAHPTLETLQKDAEAAKNELTEMEQKVKEASARIEELNKLKEKNLLTSAESDELDYLSKQNEVYTEQLKLLKEIADYKEQQAKDRANEEAVTALSAFKQIPIDEMPSMGSVFFGGNIGATAEDMRGSNQYDLLMAAIQKYGEVQSEIDALSESISGSEKDDYQQIKANIDAKNVELEHWKSILERSKESLAEILGKLTGEEDIAYVNSLLSMIADTGAFDKASDGLAVFKKGLKDIGDDADSIVKKFLKGEKLTNAEANRLIQTLEKMGLSVEDAAAYFTRLSEEMEIESPSVNTSGAIGNLVTFRDELERTKVAIEEYNKFMEGGEKGDLANQYKGAWEKATEGLAEGKTDTNALRAAASLFFTPEQIAEMGYDLETIGQKLSGGLFKAIFGGEGDTGANFGNYLRDNAEQYSEFVNVINNSDGSFSLAISDFEGLANAMGISLDFLIPLLDALDVFGTQVILDDKKLGEFKTTFEKYKKSVLKDARKTKTHVTEEEATQEGIRGIVNDLITGGADEYTALATMRALQKEFPDMFKGVTDELITQFISDALKKNKESGDTGEGEAEKSLEEVKAKYQQMIEDLQASIDGNPVNINVGVQPDDEYNTLISLDGENIDVTVGVTNTDDLNDLISFIPEDGNGGNITFTCDDEGTASRVLEEINKIDLQDRHINFIVQYVDGETGEVVPFGGGQPTSDSQSTEELVSQYKELKQVVDELTLIDQATKTFGGPAAAAGTTEQLQQAKEELEQFIADHPDLDFEAIIQAKDEATPTIKEVAKQLDALPKVTNTTVRVNVSGNVPEAQASGTKSARGGPTLVNELGPEVISENGHAYIAAGGLPAIVNLSKGAVVLNAEETERVLSGKQADVEVGGGFRTLGATDATLPGTSSPPPSSPSGGGSSSSKKNKGKNKVDWIEVAIDRLTKAIDSLSKVFESSFKSLDTRLSSSLQEIEKIQEGFNTYQAGYERYMREAESVGLGEDIARLVRDGTIDIAGYDDKTKKKIDEYKQW